MEPHSFPGFRMLFDELLRFGLSRHVPVDEVEDLIGSTLESALKHYDPARGDFRALCYTSLSNLIKNHWRDRKPVVPFDDTNDPEDPEWQKGFSWDENQEMKEMLTRIMEDLTQEEKDFLLQLQALYDEIEDRAVSEAARRLGLEPKKGWNIFRKIQRKARSLYPETMFMRRPTLPEMPAEPTEPAVGAETTGRPPVEALRIPQMPLPLSYEIQLLASFTTAHIAFQRLMSKFSPEKLPAFESILSPRRQN